MDIIGTVKDIQPNAAKPTLELAFPRSDSGQLSSGRRAAITLLIDGVNWHGTVRNDGSRDAYVHTRLLNEVGQSATCTEVLTGIGAGHNSRLRFEVISPDTIRLGEIIQNGEYRRRQPAPTVTQSASRSAPLAYDRLATTADARSPSRD